MRLSYLSLPLLFAVSLVNAQGGTDAFCTADDGSATGSSAACMSGFCRFNQCAASPVLALGEACTQNNQCGGTEAAYDQPPSCAGTCGGAGAFCYADDGSGTGTSAICFSGTCKSNQCISPTPVGAGEACTSSFECPGDISCQNGFCTGGGASCSATTDGSATGSSTECFSGFCRSGACADVPVRQVGETCSSSNVCVGAESWNELPPSCGNDPGTAAICGGASTFCYASDGSGTGPDPICASGQCKSNACTSTTPSEQGGACLGDYQCPGDIFCQNGFCTGGGRSCTASSDGSSTGPSDQCLSGFCRSGTCADVPVRQVGETCSSSNVCVGAESWNELPPSCGGTIPICGGAGTFCYASDGSGTGADPVCASGQCFQNACTAPTVSPGLKKRADLPAQHIVKQRLCPRGYEPCPVFRGGYECIDIMGDLESCGGCVGLGGIDCSADIHAVDVSCVLGRCVIYACEVGFAVASENNTCTAV